MLRIRDRHERDMLFGPTNEEVITDIFRTHVRSYRELPGRLYHIQWKFRDEVRPRFGVMRGREFLMKDRSEEHTSELQSLMRISYAVFCLKKKIQQQNYSVLSRTRQRASKN